MAYSSTLTFPTPPPFSVVAANAPVIEYMDEMECLLLPELTTLPLVAYLLSSCARTIADFLFCPVNDTAAEEEAGADAAILVVVLVFVLSLFIRFCDEVRYS